jgi:hypothetical protein
MKLRLLFFTIVGILLLALSAHTAVLIPTASTWRWRPGTNEASTPVGQWRTVGFADSQFTTAPAPFWYGDVLPGGTQITGMQNVYGCLFLRKTFVLTNLTEIGGLRMGSLVDDGFVAWINGAEVLRVSMPGAPGDPVTVATLANNAVEPVSFTTNNLPAPPSYLVLGTNVLAVQLFQSALNSSDLGFECSLESVVSETNPPTVLSVTPAPGTITNLTQITVTFSEPVSGVAAAFLQVNGIGAAGLSGDGATYTFTFVQPAYGNVAITWSGGHNIFDQALPPNRFDATGPGATWNYTLVDNTTPKVAALTPSTGATVRSLNGITVLFSEAVSGVEADDLLINNTPASSVTPVAATEFTFAFPQPPTGAVQVAWAAGHGILDLATPPNAFAGGNWTYRLDPNAADAAPYISEFMASNTRTNGVGSLIDEDREANDWIEIYNPGGVAVNLDGWFLTDSAGNLNKWRFPATNLAGGNFLVVFASGKDRRVPGARLHASFSLSAGGEYLALVKPDGVTIASEFAPAFPQQMPDVSHGYAQSGSPPAYATSAESVYFTTATPGAVNLGGTAVPGPVIEDVTHTPNVPLDHQDLLVTARVRPSFRAIGGVTMRYRIMFSNELTTAMFDDGAHGDGAAGDGVYGATIPANLSTNGQMIRYFIAATDVTAAASRWPLYTSPTATEQYLGTIVSPTNVTSKLPIFHLFVDAGQMAGIDSEAGGRLAFFYDGEFYDNIYMELRGNTSAGLNKKAHRLEFLRGHELRHAGPGPRTRKSSLLAEKLDPAYVRQHLCFWFLNSIGVPAPYDYPVRVQMNGAFYQLAFHSDVIGQEQVERLGYDPRGALYKAVGNLVPAFTSTGVFQKLEPDNDTSRTDYLQLANGINESSSVTVRRNTVFDLLDLPQVINHLTGARWCSENDDVWANMSIYRDTFGDGLWRCIPFDMNASWGQLYGAGTTLEATVDGSKSHPLYGGASTGGNYNRLYDVIVTLPETRQMLLRRQRTVMDRMVQPPGTPATSRILENYIIYMTNQIAPEAALDRARWGNSDWAPGKTFVAGVDDLLNAFVGPRRSHWYVTHSITNTSRAIGIGNNNNAGIPLSQPSSVSFSVVGVEFNPAGGNQEQEYVVISNTAPIAIDITGWKLEGGIDFTFQPGTVLPSNGVAYVSPNTRQFRARATGPRGGQGLFVLGPYRGQLSARGETILVKNTLGLTVNSNTYTGAPSLAQQFLRITEVMFHPSALPENPTLPDEFEYIELKNISTNTTLNLANVRFVNGVEFNFTGSAVTSLAPGARVLVVRNTIAFAARYGGGLPVAGQFTGNLDNDGERIQLLDASNEEILDFSYDDDWYPITDGLGFALSIVDEAAEPDAWDDKIQWRVSGALGGSPGNTEPEPPVFAPVLITEALTRTDVPPPTDAIEIHNPAAQSADISGWWLTDDFNTPAKFRIPEGTIIAANGYATFDESQFNPGGAGFGLSSDGDEVWVFSADAAGNLTGYVHGHNFGAADDGVSFGRHVTSEGKVHFVAQASRTLGASGSGPRVGPVVISEIMYRPPDLGTNDNSADEYVEVLNTTADPVPLFDSTNTWRLRGGVDFDFPPGLTLGGGELILLVNFNPTNSAAAATFRTKYSVPAGVRLFGPYSGKLDNSGGDVELKKPTLPVLGVVPFVLMDKVDYRDVAPWPTGADGFGLSLHRIDAAAYGNDPTNWVAVAPSAARPYISGGTAPSIVTQPADTAGVAGRPLSLSVTVAGTEPFSYQWRFNGTALFDGPNYSGANSPVLTIAALESSHAGAFSVFIFNAGGSVESAAAQVRVLFPLSILAQPASRSIYISPDPRAVRVIVPPVTNVVGGVTNIIPGVTNPAPTNVTFTVNAATSDPPLRYQWRFNGVDIPGATGFSLTVTNVQLANEGDYSCLLADGVAPVLSDSARLTPLLQPVLVKPPVGQTVVEGSDFTHSVEVTGNPVPIAYSWRRGSIIIATNSGNYRSNFLTLNAAAVGLILTNNIQSSNYTMRIVIYNEANNSPGVLYSWTNTVLADFDRDGIPDVAENSLGLSSSNALDAGLDLDGDGMSNRAEYTAGTDPASSLSYLRLDQGPGAATVSVAAISNRTYTVQFTDRLSSGVWSRLADIVARPFDRVETITDPAWTTNRFYRLATPRQP